MEDEAEELLERLQNIHTPGAMEVRDLLQRARETAAFALKADDARSMGWPLTIAAAAYLAQAGAGLIQADEFGWMRPHGREVRWIVEE